MAINRLQAALANITTDLTAAAAQINFDFTLLKIEAPPEFQPLGNVLSRQRKELAECGTPHITAKRLGALFDGVCPPTLNLFRAYGLRVSEIAEAIENTTEPETAGSVFAEHSGFDGTSIWAAATTSPAAIQVQLLACMLARVWNAPEATSVWVELVKERRAEVTSRFSNNETVPIPTLYAAGQADIPRSSLAEWDASARAWLKTADNVKDRDQKRLILLVADLTLGVNNEMTLYSSVLSAWKSALESVEKLVSGMPQSINSGPSLLALSSWHLYPDILMIGSKIAEHRFKDALVAPGGILTVGLNYKNKEEPTGVFWSLSLAHMNYYGHPIRSESRLDLDTCRITFQQFAQAFWAGVLQRSDIVRNRTAMGARLFTSISECLQRVSRSESAAESVRKRCGVILRDRCYWFNILASAAYDYLAAQGDQDDIIHKLVETGRRRAARGFMGGSGDTSFLDIISTDWLLQGIRSQETRVEFLRRFISPDAHPMSSLIIYDNDSGLVVTTGRPMHRPDGTVGHKSWIATNNGQLPPGSASPADVVSDLQSLHFQYSPLGDDRFTILYGSDESSKTLSTYQLETGSLETAAIYQDVSQQTRLRDLTLEDIIWCFESDAIDPNNLLEFIDNLRGPESSVYVALSVAAQIYRILPTATVSVKTLYKPFGSTCWANQFARPGQGTATSPEPDGVTALACVAFMEGCFDLEPSSLRNVFAVAFEDSIYVLMRVGVLEFAISCAFLLIFPVQLVCDPWDQPRPFELKKITGNVGRPGLTLMLPPDEVIMRNHDPASWRAVSTTLFNGQQENYFSSTSMHLSFTKYQIPFVAGNRRQIIDTQVHFVETVISVHDSGVWVGDVDILKAFRSEHCLRLDEDHDCDEESPGQEMPKIGDVISVESWHDILDPPPRQFVFRD
ncbi:hypothetical protein OQA88_222 [Cercophora sp. LCS_1]